MMFKEFTLEFKAFCKMFYYFTVSIKILKELNGDISVFDVLNHYKTKTLTDRDLYKLKDVKLYNFKCFKGVNTDLMFISFKISNIDLNKVNAVFNPSNRTYRKYKYEFSKFERSLIFKLKNTDKYEYNHKDCISESLQIDLNGEYSVLPLEKTYINTSQNFETEYEFKKRKKEEKWKEIKRKQKLKSEAIKSLRLWKKIEMPRLPWYKKEKKEKFNPETLKKEKGWRTGQKRDLLGFLYIDAYGNLDTDLTVAPIKIPQKIKEKEKRTLW